jgi:hypothetical protein
MNNQPLPNLPVPDPPKDPACEWCGERPAEPYEVAPPVLSYNALTGEGKERQKVKTMVKRTTMAYACKHHREVFDRRKDEAEKRAQVERERKKRLKVAGK